MEKKWNTRRGFLRRLAAAGAGGWALKEGVLAPPAAAAEAPGRQRGTNVPVQYPNGGKLPWRWDHGVKVFHLVAEPVKQELIPGTVLDLWGYSGSAPGPMIEVNEGDRVRILFENHLPEPTAIHWHGLEVPNDMDGVPGITQPYIVPGGRFTYEFTLRQNGTYFYHSHMAMQEMLGMIGPFIIHPKIPYSPAVQQDFAIVLQEYAVLPGNSVPNTMSMEYNWLTMNGKSAPAITPLVARLGDRVRVRLMNLGMDGHPIHLHGMQFWLTGTEGGRQPVSNWIRRNTVWVAVAQAWDCEFEANNPGTWMLHCHLPHHMMNNMASTVGPITRGYGLPTGISMPTSMGMPSSGAALSRQYGPSLGRGMGLSSRRETPEANGPQNGAAQASMASMPGMPRQPIPPPRPRPGQPFESEPRQEAAAGQMHGMQPPNAIAPNANQVPGFPQDAYMEGPRMNMDSAVASPETYGLPPGWSGFMGGMMVLVRVVDDALYQKIQDLRRQAGRTA